MEIVFVLLSVDSARIFFVCRRFQLAEAKIESVLTAVDTNWNFGVGFPRAGALTTRHDSSHSLRPALFLI
jgi:hypothetical protein